MEVLIETRMNALHLTESKSHKRGCLGRLEGVCADFKNPTRNGRLYPLALWEKVFEDSLFKESLSNKTLFGELDHPEDRFEPLISEACVVMTDYRIDKDKGLIYGGFDILDTPKGRILKSIVDYGSVVGVSSRGQGDIVESADGEKVDEDSYEFACFDVVSTPAVEKARQMVKESIKKIGKKDFTESVKQQIADAETISDLNIIRSVVRTSQLNSSEIDSLIESIEYKCKSLQSSDEETILSESSESNSSKHKNVVTESAKTIRDNKKLYKCIRNLKEKVSAYKHRESSYIDLIESKDYEINGLCKKLDKLESIHSNFKTKQKQVTESLDRQLMKSESKLNDFEDEFSSLTSENASLSKKLRGALTDNERLSKQLESLKSDNNKLIHENDNLVNENDSLVKELKIARNDNDNLSKQIKSRDNLTEKLISKSDKLKDDISVKSEKENKLQEQLKKSSDRITYLETQLENISKTHQEDISSMDNEVEEYNRLLNEAQSKLDNSNNTVKELKESLSQTEKTLASSQNRNKQLLEGIKKYQEKYLNKVASVAGVNSNSLKQSISYETTPDQIDLLVESLRDRIDRHNKLGLSKNNLNINSDYVVATNKQGSDDNSEDSKLLSFLTTTQVSL